MAVTPFDSAMMRGLFGDDDIARLFSDSAEVRAMLLVEGALAQAQGELGVIPAESAAFIKRAVMEVQIDPAGLSAETGVNAVVVPALVKAFHAATDAPEHAQYFHWGATSQDIMDTALVLRLKQVLALFEGRLQAIIKTLGALAQAHADLPMAGRTYGQIASPTTFGATVTTWGMPLIDHLQRLTELRPRLLRISLFGAAGTASQLENAPVLRRKMAGALGLEATDTAWHSTRDSIAEYAGWLALVTGSLGKMGGDLLLLTQSGIAEVSLGSGGASSTMPQKSNPVLPSLLVALARQATALNSAIQGAQIHRQQRDGAAWFVEWMNLGQITMATGRALTAAGELTGNITPDPDRMLAHINDGLGLIHAEALSFELAKFMPRPQAQTEVKALCQQAKTNTIPLPELAHAKWPDIPASLFTPVTQLGEAPAQARAFAEAAKTY
ncbi:class-II fumarase/aspartase family protein [Profundibacter amoris]|uniref:Adenylosuccinate lyase family protein n=1 Tax=Profundibacter amoris TaxID=2171755 RepID=A0A347UDU7_9RHOB|nr:adenylosuccinate lyase family protein [Profundibacter amoris]AXX97025.1 adenylosuccinate lyase family protein [Profundibacter amoris]